jgi:hypothetical protein
LNTAKLVIGIISIVLFAIIAFQSCATGVVNVVDGVIAGEEVADTSASGGMALAFSMLIAGIVGVAARKSKGGSIAAGVFYLLGCIVGFANLGTFGDLVIWAILSLIFGAIFIISGIMMKKPTKEPNE